MRTRTAYSGFTLIELLIVVAIIAILAAIAVPNFLEAQTRAKVSRSLANCRNIATALGAYRVDNNNALPATGNNYWWAHRVNFALRLSTPVAYMVSPPEDPFCREWYDSAIPGADMRAAGYSKIRADFTLWDHNIIHALIATPIGSAPGMWSPVAGVDKSLLRTYLEPSFHMWNHAGASYMFRGQGPKWYDQPYNTPYDPTNGTLSVGHIYFYE